jgi:hypothetical protein
MSTRERWVVYPLLFFALLSSLKDQLALPTNGEFQSLTCNQLTVESADGRPLLELGSSSAAAGDESGLLVVYGAVPEDELTERRPIAASPARRPQRIVLGSESAGGYVRSFGSDPAPILKFGHEGAMRKSGTFAETSIGQPLDQSEGETAGSLIDWAPEAPAAAPARDDSETDDSETDASDETAPAAATN